jgi:NAD(P)-dependent dehydrogenase (short-subunit alcohol dehydrogenase family)
MLLHGLVSIVTGAASGIGRATAVALAREGSVVAAVDRDESGLASLGTQLGNAGAEVMTLAVDLGDLAAASVVVDDVVGGFGRVDHLVNCAGVTGPPSTLLDTELPEWERVYAVNLEAPLLLMQGVARHLIGRGCGGRIVNVSSSSAFRARQSQLAYGSSKAALVQLTRSVAAELGAHDINVNAVAPGLTRSAMTAPIGETTMAEWAAGDGPLGNLLGRVSEPEDVAAVIAFLCLPASRQITGQTIHTSAGAVV